MGTHQQRKFLRQKDEDRSHYNIPDPYLRPENRHYDNSFNGDRKNSQSHMDTASVRAGLESRATGDRRMGNRNDDFDDGIQEYNRPRGEYNPGKWEHPDKHINDNRGSNQRDNPTQFSRNGFGWSNKRHKADYLRNGFGSRRPQRQPDRLAKKAAKEYGHQRADGNR